jgi:hypothetical protein
MEFFYDGQIRRYIAQLIRMLSNFKYKTADGAEKVVPVTYGDPTSQVASILRDNSENKLPSTPRIALYITQLELDRSRLSDATYVNKLHVRERFVNEETNQYEASPGRGYTVERLMPTPYKLSVKADIWTTNATQKLQILEQILVLYNPSLEIQTTDNYVDWTSLSVVELTGVTFSNRTIPVGTNDEIDIASLDFETPIFITPPAKVTRMGVIHTIITNIFTEDTGSIDPTFIFGDPASVQYITPGNYGLLVINNEARLLSSGESVTTDEVPEKYGIDVNWYKLLDQFGNFRAGISRIYLKKADGTEIVGVMSVNPNDENVVFVNWDPDTYPTNTIIGTRGTIDAIINPLTYAPQQPLAVGLRFLLLEDIGDAKNINGALAWKNLNGSDFVAKANDIIEWDGERWVIVFPSSEVTDIIYITNLRTGIQFKWDGKEWTKSFEGVYPSGAWRLQL